MVVMVAVTLPACLSEEFDPGARAQWIIAAQIESELGIAAEVTCADPPSTDVGATFDCTAAGADGNDYHFVVTVLEGEQIATELDVRFEG